MVQVGFDGRELLRDLGPEGGQGLQIHADADALYVHEHGDQGQLQPGGQVGQPRRLQATGQDVGQARGGPGRVRRGHVPGVHRGVGKKHVAQALEAVVALLGVEQIGGQPQIKPDGEGHGPERRIKGKELLDRRRGHARRLGQKRGKGRRRGVRDQFVLAEGQAKACRHGHQGQTAAGQIGQGAKGHGGHGVGRGFAAGRGVEKRRARVVSRLGRRRQGRARGQGFGLAGQGAELESFEKFAQRLGVDGAQRHVI